MEVHILALIGDSTQKSRIVHINNVAGQSSLIVHFMQDNYPYIHEIVARRANDPFRLSVGYPGGRWTNMGNIKWFATVAVLKSLLGADLTHVHSAVHDKSRASRFYNLAVRGKPFILHYHGSDVMNYPSKVRAAYERKASKVVVSVPDLLDYEFAVQPVHVPTLIDPAVWKRRRVPANNKGLCIMKSHQSPKKTLELLREMSYGDVDWEFRRLPHRPIHPDDRLTNTTNMMVPPGRMADHFAEYEWYADISLKGDHQMMRLNTAGLQAASVGCKVVTPNGDIMTDLPDEHKPSSVCRRIDRLYREVLSA